MRLQLLTALLSLGLVGCWEANGRLIPVVERDLLGTSEIDYVYAVDDHGKSKIVSRGEQNLYKVTETGGDQTWNLALDLIREEITEPLSKEKSEDFLPSTKRYYLAEFDFVDISGNNNYSFQVFIITKHPDDPIAYLEIYDLSCSSDLLLMVSSFNAKHGVKTCVFDDYQDLRDAVDKSLEWYDESNPALNITHYGIVYRKK